MSLHTPDDPSFIEALGLIEELMMIIAELGTGQPLRDIDREAMTHAREFLDEFKDTEEDEPS